ncbi:TetR family transcriptional regulator [Novosphingobium sp. FSY-8]|uniref:TetR family transcriptional regulator n=1 Tax=Novosphingobium ovatum TaxID=1908523 RepID=A0ABW9XE30_9SPHN|nr:TetR family transcriptional regulator [Novosphingobium ovatum]NBC36792.1 TetR family transcriptional regulator [Novosphingobium ovatum]
MTDAPPSQTAPAAPVQARDQLLDTASHLMREGDTVDISLSELASASGLNSALVKYYFGNKAGLLRALLERDFAAILRAVDTLLAKDADPETKLRLHMSAVVNTFFRTPYIHRLLMRLIRECAADEGQRLADTYLKPLMNAYERLIGEGVAAGVFRPVDPQFFYFTVIGAADRFFTARYVLRYTSGTDILDEALRDKYRAHLNDFVVAGILVQR